MSDIFREVDEALQREKAAKFWKDYGPTLAVAAVVLVLSTAATTAWQKWDSWRDRQETARLLTAIEAEDISSAMKEAAEETRDGHEAIALMSAAAKDAQDGKFEAAAASYKKVMEDSSAAKDFRDLATILHARAAILAAGDNAPDFAGLAGNLETLAKDEKSAFSLQARLDAALLYGDGLKQYDRALDFLKDFNAAGTSQSLQEKADALRHVYEYEMSKQSATIPATAAPAQE